MALEVEDIDFGASRNDEDLADDVDDRMAEDDPEALDTDNEEDDMLNEALGLEELDCKYDHLRSRIQSHCLQPQCTSCRYIRYYPATSR